MALFFLFTDAECLILGTSPFFYSTHRVLQSYVFISVPRIDTQSTILPSRAYKVEAAHL
jgi:hypothetical protein